MRTDATARGEVGSQAVRLDLNGGGNTIRVRSGDGSIRIERYRITSYNVCYTKLLRNS